MKAYVLSAFFLLLVVLTGFNQRGSKVLELEQLVLKSPTGSGKIILGFEKGSPTFQMFSGQKGSAVKISFNEDKAAILLQEEGKNQVMIAGGAEPEFSLYQNEEAPSAKLFASSNGSQLYLADTSMRPSLFLQGGDIPGFFLKNAANQTVGSWSLLNDGGAVLGLGMGNGNAATVLRGGSQPNISFFSEKGDPMAALGMIKRVPHLLVSGPTDNEGILLHGGDPSSMVVVDELGKVKILISKHGVFQGKKEQSSAPKKKQDRIFSYQDLKKLSIQE